MAKVMLTTVDNPYNPFKNFDAWLTRDLELAREQNRPPCCNYLAQISMTSDDLSEKEAEDLNEIVIDDIVELNLSGTFMKISEEEAENLI